MLNLAVSMVFYALFAKLYGVTGGTDGILATNAGTGGISVTTGAGLITGSAGSAVEVVITNAASADDIVIDIGTGGATATDDAVFASTVGTGDVTITTDGAVSTTGAAASGIEAQSTSGTITTLL